tara:strand:- start:185334 stop:187682 length:2349 start_codon:yes stop_codon:yes gene_type:complete
MKATPWSKIARNSLLTCATVCQAFNGSVGAAEPKRNELPKKQHKTSEAPFLSPQQAVDQMAIPAGFEVSIFAAEPDIGEPIAFCFDDRGRMWVVENFNYRTRRQHTEDRVTRIQILEDTDSDGVFDRKKTFTDKLTFTSGIALGFGGVFVGSPPNLSFIPDADGDDVPDGPAEVLLDGWGINDRHETLNSFNWGPDGWLYGCHGVFTHSHVGKPGDDESKRQFIDAGIWRYHPTKKKFEVFARGLSNPWGFDFDDHGQGFATCCVIPHLFHVIQGGVYHKQNRPHVNPHVYDDIKTIRDHTHLSAHGGARVYLADAFPREYRNRLFMCNIHEHAVLTDVLVRDGSGFIGKHGDDFLPANDLAWVGFSVEIGPEGGVYLLDWHDTDVCGNAINFPNSGRVYRVMPKGAPRIVRPDLRSMSDEQLVGLQDNTNDWYVRQARVLLHSRAASGALNRPLVHDLLWRMFEAAPASAKKLRALWALHVTGGLSHSRLVRLLSHDDEYVRAWSIQLLCEDSDISAFGVRPSGDQAELPASLVQRLASMAKGDPSPVVRLYLAAALGRMSFDQRWSILEGLAQHGEDVDDHNLPRMIWFALEPMVPADPQRALKLAVHSKMPMLSQFVARRMVSGDAVSQLDFSADQSAAAQQKTIQSVAAGFRVDGVGEGGVVHHTSFRNRSAVQTHPKDRTTPCRLTRAMRIPAGKRTRLNMQVSHHPHGDWQLRVFANQDLLIDKTVDSKSMTDEWMNVSVDLSSYTGKEVQLTIENRANGWRNEWAYWNKVDVISE